MERQVSCVEEESPGRNDVERLAKERLASECPLGGCLASISLEYDAGTLTLRGRLPSFYAKQLLQETLRGVQGISHIRNHVEVSHHSTNTSSLRTTALRVGGGW